MSNGYFAILREAYILNLSHLLSLEPSEKFIVGGGGGGSEVETAFSVKIRIKPS